MQRIRRRGVIRVGYNEDKLPFAFFNERGTLVGYDIDMAHAFARELGVTIEFVRFNRATLIEQLSADHFDVVMSGLVGTSERAQAMQHTKSYMDLNFAFVARDFRAGEFRTRKSINSQGPLRVGFVDLSPAFLDEIEAALPGVNLVKIRNNRGFFDGEFPGLDALLISAESGSAFTLLYPDFEVVIPEDLLSRIPLFYAIGNRDAAMRDFLEYWMTLREKDGTSQEYYDHWVLGKTNSGGGPRWSIIRDYLHWVE